MCHTQKMIHSVGVRPFKSSRMFLLVNKWIFSTKHAGIWLFHFTVLHTLFNFLMFNFDLGQGQGSRIAWQEERRTCESTE